MNRIKLLLPFLLIAAFMFSCVKDLDVEPIDPAVATANNVFKTSQDYKMALAKIYASYALSGQQGDGGGKDDIYGIDGNFGNYLRQYFGLQELSTDEAIMAWDDNTIKDFHWHTWSSNDTFIMAMYSRIFFTVTICNEFIRNVDSKMGSVSFAADLKTFKAEARFMRALSYWHAIDMFGNVPFVTEADKPGTFFPNQIQRKDLFTYIENELKSIENEIKAPKQNEYPRVDRAAVWFLLSKLYLNAKVYTGAERNNDAITYLNKVITSGYSLDDKYKDIFCADNNTSPEIIFAVAFDGKNTQQYGGMTFILNATQGGGMPDRGVGGGWGGIRTIKELVTKFNIKESDFDNNSQFSSADNRGMFFFKKDDWKWDVGNVGNFKEGIGVMKYSNYTSDGKTHPNASGSFASTDFPMFRLADAYLMYAEAVVRGGSGDKGTAVNYINQLRQRAYGNNSGNITESDLTLDFILDERARELYWEGHRRTDLIRFDKFTTGNYHWTWKGKDAKGIATQAYRNLYPIPANDINANKNLKQNLGYN